MTNDNANLLSLDIYLADSSLGNEIEAWLADNDAHAIDMHEERGVMPLLPIVITALLSFYTLVHLGVWLRSRTQCQIIIDARARRIRKEIDCRVRDGRLIILTHGDIKVEILNPAGDDLTPVVAAAIGGEAADIIQAATTSGVTARVLP